MRVLLVEDNKSISKGLIYSFEQSGYRASLRESFEDALKETPFDFDVIVLDVALPDGSGFELFEEIRRVSDAPVIFLTAIDDEDSVVKGLELGADDYITKPFSTRELLARMKRLTLKSDKPNIIKVGDLTTDLDSMTVTKNGEPVQLTALEYKIFSVLVQNAGRIVTRELMLEKIWDVAGNFVNDNTLTVYIKRIRQKTGTDAIKTIKGLGYKLEEK